MKTAKLLENLQKALLYIIVLSVPLVVNPVFQDPFGLPKLTIVFFGTLLILVLKAIDIILKGRLEIKTNFFDLPLFLIVLSYVASAVLRSPNKMEAFFNPGHATLAIVGFLIYFFVNQLEVRKPVKYTLVISSLLVTLVYLFSYIGILSNIENFLGIPKNLNFNTIGDTISLIIYISISLFVSVILLAEEKDLVKKVFLIVSSMIIIFGVGISIYNALPGRDSAVRLPGFRTSWIVMTDAIKDNPLFGTGVGNYLYGFNRFRDLTYNSTDLWNTRFSVGQSYMMTFVTETGLLGLSSLVILLITVIRKFKKEVKSNNLDYLTLVVGLLLLAVLPGNTAILFLFFLLFGLIIKNDHVKHTYLKLHLTDNQSKMPSYILAGLIIAGVFASSFFSAKYLLAESKYKKSLDLLSQNKAKESYETLQEAIELNRYVDRYRISYAQINLAIADSISKKKELTDDDRKTVAQLIQQAIREGKSAVVLNQQRSGNWEVLGKIYQSIIPFTQGSDKFAVETYRRAVSLDPINPNLRIALGGIYYSAGNYEGAIDMFKLAVIAKPDHANSHYNLAIAYRDNKETEKAIEQLNLVLSLVNKDSADYQLAKEELDNIQKKNPKPTQAKDGNELDAPQPSPTPAINPQLTLPEDSNPPEVEPVPTASPSPTPNQ